MRIEVKIQLDDRTLKVLRMFADFLELSLEDFIVDYLESEFIVREFYKESRPSKTLSASMQKRHLH